MTPEKREVNRKKGRDNRKKGRVGITPKPPETRASTGFEPYFIHLSSYPAQNNQSKHTCGMDSPT